MIKFSNKELSDLVEDKESCVEMKTFKQVMSLHASCLVNVKRSVLETLSNAVGKFDKRLDGVILSYVNVKICSIGIIRNDSPDVHYEVEANFYIFRPFVGAVLQGFLNRKCDTHLSLIVHKVFNVVIPRPVNNVSFTWSDSSWVGSKLMLGQRIAFKIEVLDLYSPLPYIRGVLDESCVNSPFFEDDCFVTMRLPKTSAEANRDPQNGTETPSVIPDLQTTIENEHELSNQDDEKNRSTKKKRKRKIDDDNGSHDSEKRSKRNSGWDNIESVTDCSEILDNSVNRKKKRDRKSLKHNTALEKCNGNNLDNSFIGHEPASQGYVEDQSLSKAKKRKHGSHRSDETASEMNDTLDVSNVVSTKLSKKSKKDSTINTSLNERGSTDQYIVDSRVAFAEDDEEPASQATEEKHSKIKVRKLKDKGIVHDVLDVSADADFHKSKKKKAKRKL